MQRKFFQAALIAVVFPNGAFSLKLNTLNTNDLNPGFFSPSASLPESSTPSFDNATLSPELPPSSLPSGGGSSTVQSTSVASQLKQQLDAEENLTASQTTPAFGSTTTRTFVPPP